MPKPLQLYGIVGESISYTLSPLIYNSLFLDAGINALYVTFDLPSNRVKRFVTLAEEIRMSGFNVTVPHKELVVRYLHRLDPIATATGSVNLVLRRRGKLDGFNTDYAGIKTTIENRLRLNLHGKHVVVLGTGGAARTVVYYLAQTSCSSITIVSRQLRERRSWRSYLNQVHCADRTDLLTYDELPRRAAPIDLLINCTPLAASALLGTRLRARCRALFELRYSPSFNDSRRHVDGKYMLAVQAAANWYLMTGRTVAPARILKIISGARA
ncbi:MAG: shikimate dehydrogenase [candidate division Zixibacteria bacterium]|nr:shikimate dehydrogenase [candidate division Zixibacteria bacterium]